jgi:hypothetical protein
MVPGQVVVAVSGNNQQFSSDRIIHFRDLENTFEYFQDFFVLAMKPVSVSNAGNSSVKLLGANFAQFKFDNETVKPLSFYCRFVDQSGNVIGSPSLMKRINNVEQDCPVPTTNHQGDVSLQLSANGY